MSHVEVLRCSLEKFSGYTLRGNREKVLRIYKLTQHYITERFDPFVVRELLQALKSPLIQKMPVDQLGELDMLCEDLIFELKTIPPQRGVGCCIS
jgi:hypothetical protein